MTQRAKAIILRLALIDAKYEGYIKRFAIQKPEETAFFFENEDEIKKVYGDQVKILKFPWGNWEEFN